MATLLSRSAILAAPVSTKDIEIPEWGGSVRVRALSVSRRVELLDAIALNEREHSAWTIDQSKPEEERDGLTRVDLYDQSVLIALFAIVDDDNEPMFSADDYAAFGELDYATIAQIWHAQHDLGKPRSVEDVKKNSD